MNYHEQCVFVCKILSTKISSKQVFCTQHFAHKNTLFNHEFRDTYTTTVCDEFLFMNYHEQYQYLQNKYFVLMILHTRTHCLTTTHDTYTNRRMDQTKYFLLELQCEYTVTNITTYNIIKRSI